MVVEGWVIGSCVVDSSSLPDPSSSSSNMAAACAASNGGASVELTSGICVLLGYAIQRPRSRAMSKTGPMLPCNARSRLKYANICAT